MTILKFFHFLDSDIIYWFSMIIRRKKTIRCRVNISIYLLFLSLSIKSIVKASLILCEPLLIGCRTLIFAFTRRLWLDHSYLMRCALNNGVYGETRRIQMRYMQSNKEQSITTSFSPSSNNPQHVEINPIEKKIISAYVKRKQKTPRFSFWFRA